MYEIVELLGQPHGKKIMTFWHCAWDTFEEACADAEQMARFAGGLGGWLLVRPDGEQPGPMRHAVF